MTKYDPDIRQKIMAIIRSEYGYRDIDCTAVAKHLKISKPLLSYHVKILVKLDILGYNKQSGRLVVAK